MPTESTGLSNAEQVEALADQLTACADQLHARLMKAIHAGGDAPAIDRSTARALLDDEAVLRQRAEGLYADAASAVVHNLGSSQAQLMALTANATEAIRKIRLSGDLTGLVGAMLALAGAAASGQPAPIVLALERIRRQLREVAADSPPAAPPAAPAA